jgi:hypothetical protein
MRIALTWSAMFHSYLTPETLMRNLSALITAVVLAFSLGSAFAGDEAPVAESSDPATASTAPPDASEPAAAESTDASSMLSTDTSSQSNDAPAADSDSK